MLRMPGVCAKPVHLATCPLLEGMTSAFKFNDAVIRHLVVRRDSAVTEASPLAKSKEKDGRDDRGGRGRRRDSGGERSAPSSADGAARAPAGERSGPPGAEGGAGAPDATRSEAPADPGGAAAPPAGAAVKPDPGAA